MCLNLFEQHLHRACYTWQHSHTNHFLAFFLSKSTHVSCSSCNQLRAGLFLLRVFRARFILHLIFLLVFFLSLFFCSFCFPLFFFCADRWLELPQLYPQNQNAWVFHFQQRNKDSLYKWLGAPDVVGHLHIMLSNINEHA